MEKGLFHRRADKGAVSAAGGTEGDAHIERDVLGQKVRLRLPACPGGREAEPCPPGGDEQFPGHLRHGLALGHAPLEHLGDQPRRADTRQRAPGGALASEGRGGLEKAQLHDALAQPVPGQGVLLQAAGPDAAFAPGLFPRPVQDRHSHGIGPAHGQADAGPVLVLRPHGAVNGLFAGEEHRHDLLGGILIIVAGEFEFHARPSCMAERMKGLLSRSVSRVLVPS